MQPAIASLVESRLSTAGASTQTLAKNMRAFHYGHSATLLGLGAIALIWGSRELYSALTADELKRIVLENSLGEGHGPEFFALGFVGAGILCLIGGWFDLRWTAKNRNDST